MPANDKEAHVPIWFTLKIGGAESAGFFKEATGFDSESEVTEIKRSLPNGRTDVIEAGQVICEIGIAPVKPAEFVIFRLSQFTGGAGAETSE
jgi:phage tail sheath protein FI